MTKQKSPQTRVQRYREKRKKKCPTCDTMILKESISCRPCHHESRIKYDDSRTLGELTYRKGYRSSAFALIRTRARSICKFSPCKACGYDKHTEVADIVPISSFTDDTPHFCH